jgi:polysaccharide export outer membrane protein
MTRHVRRPRAARPAPALPALLALALAACAGTGGAPPGPEPGAYRVGPPDALHITVLPEPVIERDVVVRPDGMISIDLIGDIAAGGRTPEEIASDIQTRIARYKRDAHVTVSLAQALSSQVTVLGEVTRPSTFPLTRETRLVEALGTVGGTGVYADKNSIRVIRGTEGRTQVLAVNLEAIERGDLRTNYLLQGGDLVYVPPGAMATIGYALQAVLFPFQQVFGFGSRVSTTVLTGGI